MTTVFLVLALISISLAALAQIFLRLTMLAAGSLPSTFAETPTYALKVLICPQLYVGLMCFGISLLLTLVVLTRLEVSQFYPMVALGIALTVLLGHFVLGESLTLLRLAGVGVILIGIMLIARS
ncbi:MAG: EamA family transporter [Succinivibrio sp.]|nr:EamA family transporter [Succinivibrio sp.]